jgi:integrase
VKSLNNERVPVGTFFNYLRGERLDNGPNPAEGKLHRRRSPRKPLQPQKDRCLTREEDVILRREGEKTVLWPILLLTRWAGLRRGEACALRWDEIDLERGFLSVVGHEGGRKHPRRVPLAPWVVRQLVRLRPGWLPEEGHWPVWPHCADHASDMLVEFSMTHLKRKVEFNDLRASFTTSGFDDGLTAEEEEAKLAGHGPEVAEKHYSEYRAQEARYKLSDDPLASQPDGGDGDDGGDLKRHRMRIAK